MKDSLELRDIYDEGITLAVEVEVEHDGVFIKGDGFEIVVENLGGKPQIMFHNRSNDRDDPDLKVLMSKNGPRRFSMMEVEL